VQFVNEQEVKFLDDVHRTEEEIDLFLERKKQEADLILQKARQDSEKFRLRIAKEALEEKDRLLEALISEAREDAEKNLQEGSRAVQREKEILEKMRPAVTKKIVDYLLGKDQ
jgi:hypothetical protein